jgi:hypothetical protein
MNHAEALAAIEVHGRRNRAEADKAITEADKARDEGEARAALFVHKEHAESVRAAAEKEALGHEARAARHTQRAETAEAGFLLHGKEERGDCAYCMKHKEVIGGAARHGLMRDQPVRPS